MTALNVEHIAEGKVKKKRQAWADLGQAQPQLGLRLTNVEI